MVAVTAGPLGLVRDGWRAVPTRHLVIAVALAVAWAGANSLGWTIGHATTNPAQTFAHFAYEALLTMLLLALAIGIADAASRDDPNAVAPYAIAAISAAIVAELVFIATAPMLDLVKCACGMDRWRPGARTANMLPDSLLICGFVTAGYRYWRRTSLRMARLNARELERAQLTRRTVESRLQAMQACIEPQFLFDTLSAVERLHASDPRTAVRLIDELIVYLRAALPHLRESTSTVAKETELAQAWLNIQRLRHGRGAALAIDVAPGAHGARMPPMVLLPLVDYVLGDPSEAVAAAGDSLRIDARIAGDALRIELAGHGTRGPVAEGGPDKLAGLRERLHTLYRDAARLTLGSGAADSILITLTLPHEFGDRDPG